MKKSIYESPELDIYMLTEDIMDSSNLVIPEETDENELPIVPLPGGNQ